MGKPVVLVAEDNVKQCALIAATVRETGFCEPVTAHNGREALDVVKACRGLFTSKIKCILLDWQMPEMDGEQFLRYLRHEERRLGILDPRDIPVIIISAHNDMPRRNLAADVFHGRVCGYLVKPFDEEKLTAMLYQIIMEKQSRRLRTAFFYERLDEIPDKKIAFFERCRGREVETN